jgi:hypothetical protein
VDLERSLGKERRVRPWKVSGISMIGDTIGV